MGGWLTAFPALSADCRFIQRDVTTIYKTLYISSSDLHNSQGKQLIIIGGFHNFVYHFVNYFLVLQKLR